jgi:hypothetical protein
MQVTLDIFLLDWERPPPGKVKVYLWGNFCCFMVSVLFVGCLDFKMELYSCTLTIKYKRFNSFF